MNVYAVTILEPEPNNGIVSFYSGRDTFVELSVILINDGPEKLPANSDGNYDFVLSFEYSEPDPDTTLEHPGKFTFEMEFSHEDEYNKGIEMDVKKNPVTFTPNATIAVPTWQCGNLTKLCVTLIHSKDIEYEDDDKSNDFYCLDWGNGPNFAGLLQCTADLHVADLNITKPDSNLIYTIGEEVSVTFDMEIYNIGWDSISATGGPTNYAFVASMSDKQDLQDDNATVVLFNVDVSDAYDLTVGITSFDSITIRELKADIIFPSEDCYMYQYICMSVSAPKTALYIDGNMTNSHYCLPFGDVEDGYGGNTPCSGYAIKFSIGLLLTTIVCSMIGRY
ncbi:uncharacterized protein LOC144357702 [Saccoglossus kowalevskii]